MKITSTRWALVLLVSLFFLWGAANNLNDVLIKQFQKAFTLGDMQASLVQTAFYAGYFLGALPAAKLVRSQGFKTSVMTGLMLFSLGSLLFWPVSRHGGSYPFFLIGLYLIAFGLAFLESAANPWIILLGNDGKPGSGTRALNFAQAFNPLGSISGILVGKLFILDNKQPALPVGDKALQSLLHSYRVQQAAAVGPPYLVLGLVVAFIAGLFWFTEFPLTSAEGLNEQPLTLLRLRTSAARLWRVPGFAQGLFAQFAYVGAQVSVWSFVIRLVQAEVPGTGEQRAADFLLLGMVLFVTGRFLATALLCVLSEGTLLGAYALLASLTCVIIAAAGSQVSIAAVSATSFFMSMIWPTIFGLALSPVDTEDTAVAAALLVMAVVGGAVVPPIMGVVSDASSIATAYLVPGACFLIVAAFALQHRLGRFEAEESKPIVHGKDGFRAGVI